MGVGWLLKVIAVLDVILPASNAMHSVFLAYFGAPF